MNDAKVILWGSMIGAVTWLEDREIGVFQYSPDFLNSGIPVAPLMMPLNEFPYEFPALSRITFKGLPGLLSDSLPDKFGNTVIDAWLASQGRTAASFNPVERLCYIGNRGMGALEFEPALKEPTSSANAIEVAKLVELVNQILEQRTTFKVVLSGKDDRKPMEDILRVGTSAGGARAKAILAWNPKTNEFRSGQVNLEPGFEHWLLKFDGVHKNNDRDISDPLGYGKVEYAYYLMASEAGIIMSECRLFSEGGRHHFMTRRFDRDSNGHKIHMQSLGAMAHFDYNQPASYSYEQSIQVIKRLGLPQEDVEQQVLRAMFNVVCCNHDDHVKNIAFLMNRNGEWRLSPAFDITYAWNQGSLWINQHQMSINGKREEFDRGDLISLANMGGIKTARANEMLGHIINTAVKWPEFAEEAKVDESRAVQIQKNYKLSL